MKRYREIRISVPCTSRRLYPTTISSQGTIAMSQAFDTGNYAVVRKRPDKALRDANQFYGNLVVFTGTATWKTGSGKLEGLEPTSSFTHFTPVESGHNWHTKFAAIQRRSYLTLTFQQWTKYWVTIQRPASTSTRNMQIIHLLETRQENSHSRR